VADIDREEHRVFNRFVALRTVSFGVCIPCLATYRVINLLLIFFLLTKTVHLRWVSHCECVKVSWAIVGGERWA
jgi:hypothetical protein